MLLEMNVTMRRGKFNLNTDLSVQDENLGLLGRSGAGKSAILGLLAGNLVPDSGRIVLDGKTLFDSRKGILMPREQRPIGAVLQHDKIHTSETVKDSLAATYERTLKQRRRLKPDQLFDILDIGYLADQAVDGLSAGEHQRVLLAKALLKSPKLLLLDDPLTSMGDLAHSITPFLKRIRSELDLPLFYASHTLDNIVEFSEKIAVVDAGRIARIGLLNDLLREAGLINKIGLHQFENKMPAVIIGHDTDNGCTLAETFGIKLVLPLRRDLPIGSWGTIAISANEIALSRNYIDGISIQNQIKGRICALIPNNSGMLVQIDCGSIWLATITFRACQDMNLQEGDSVYCLAKTQAFSYWPNLDPAAFTRLFGNDGLKSK